jgi:hypothetical protein
MAKLKEINDRNEIITKGLLKIYFNLAIFFRKKACHIEGF